MSKRILAILTLAAAAALAVGAAAGPAEAVKVKTIKVISENASNRASSYELANKIVTARDKIFVAWLDGDQHVRVDTYEISSDAWIGSADLGPADDNHGGPVLTMDSRGYLYAVFGPHAQNPLRFRKSLRPYDARAWDDVKTIPSGNATYPCAVFDDKDTMHVVYRCHVTPDGPIVLRYLPQTSRRDLEPAFRPRGRRPGGRQSLQKLLRQPGHRRGRNDPPGNAPVQGEGLRPFRLSVQPGRRLDLGERCRRKAEAPRNSRLPLHPEERIDPG